jgi:hypothetical protein
MMSVIAASPSFVYLQFNTEISVDSIVTVEDRDRLVAIVVDRNIFFGVVVAVMAVGFITPL